MAKKVKIAPSLKDIRRNGNVFECEYNKIRIKWVIAMDCAYMSKENEKILKQWMQSAIGKSSRLWQVPYLLNKGNPYPSVVYMNDERFDYPTAPKI